MIGKLLGGRYRIKGHIGEGGMASVYVAQDERLNRRVAIKVLQPKLAATPELRKRFLIEAQTLSGFDHSNIIRFFDYSGQKSDLLWIVTEILRGANLSQFIRKYPKRCLHPVIATMIIHEVCRALAYAHKQGVYHRDVKPENIFILKDGRVKLMDFGIAKDVNRGRMTLTGMFMGSPSYMAPEQIKGDSKIDQRSDIYSLCVTFFEILSGDLPFRGANHAQIIEKIIRGVRVSVADKAPWVPDSLERIIQKGMAFDPDERYGSIYELSEHLLEFLDTHGFSDTKKELFNYFSNRPTFEKRLKKSQSLREPRIQRERQRAPHRFRRKESLVVRGKRGAGSNSIRATKKSATLLHLAKTVRDSRYKKATRKSVAEKSYYPPRKFTSMKVFYLTGAGLLLVYFYLFSSSFLEFNDYMSNLKQQDFVKELMELPDKASEMKKDLKKEIKKELKKEFSKKPLPPASQDRKVYVVVDPPGHITLNGKDYGFSDDEKVKKGITLEDGRYLLKIKRDGYKTLVRTISYKGGALSLRYKLEAKSGKKVVVIRSNKARARIQVFSMNGDVRVFDKKIEGMGYKLRLEVGKYRVVVSYRGKHVVRVIDVKKGTFSPTIFARFE